MEKFLLFSLLVAGSLQAALTANVPLHIKDGSTALKTGVSRNVVAFSAVMNDHLDAKSSDVTVVFQKVITNVGKGYDSTTGIFRAPVRGIYYFQVFCLAEMNRAAGFDLYHNSKATNYFTYSAVPNGMGVGGNAIILELEKFDNVFLKLKKGHAVHNHPYEHHNTFTGHLLEELPQATTDPTDNSININVG